MKRLLTFLISAILIACFTAPGFSQSLKEKTDNANVIYVAPLQFYKYYGIKTQTLQTGEAFAGRDYTYGKEYEVGEDVKTTVDVYEIVGEVSNETLEAINDNLLARCKDFFGEDKVKLWPEEVKKGAGDYDQKAIDCDFYIILSRVAWASPVALKTFVFNEQDKDYKMMGDTETIKLTIFEKAKAGKKGKKVAAATKGVFFQVDPLVYRYVDKNSETEAAKQYTEIADKALADKVNQLLDELFAEVGSI